MKYTDKNQFVHYTNDGTYKFLLPEYNEILYTGNDIIETSPFLEQIQQYTRFEKLNDLLYIMGDPKELDPYRIKTGGEAVVYNNTPFSVVKLLSVSPKQMLERNSVPTAVPCSLRAIINNSNNIKYLYHQIKVNEIDLKNTLFAFMKLDTTMMKCGFFQVPGYSNDLIRVYTDGFRVIDDIGYENIGIGSDNRIHIIDCAVFDIDDWEETNEINIPNKIACIGYNSSLINTSVNTMIATKLYNITKQYKEKFDQHFDINIF